MCGITAIVTLESIITQYLNGPGYLKTVKEALDKSLATIEHRGPDSRCQWVSEDNRVGTKFTVW